MRKIIKFFLAVILLVVVAAGGLIGYLSLSEYAPAATERLLVNEGARKDTPAVGSKLTLVSMNIGYGGLGRNQNFFMDGGTMVRPEKKEDVEGNLAGILSVLALQKADLYLLQEVDMNAHRTFWINEADYFAHGLSLSKATAYNYKCEFVPFPWPMIGKVESGLMTLSGLKVTEATRQSLPVPFSWPVRVANMKRCLLVERIPVEGGKELVIINLHLEAFDDGEGKRAQTEQLMRVIGEEAAKGNYVVAGGDFNQWFPKAAEKYPMLDETYWQPGQLDPADLPAGFTYVFDPATPTCRSVHANYSGDRNNWQFYVIDGFILSDNVKVNHVETIDLNFQNSDHQPVRLEFTLM